MIMQGFVGFRIPIWVRRVVTMVPAFIVVGLGANATNALVISQVVLSIALPLPMISLLMFTRRADIMGQFANSRLTQIAALVGTAIVLVLNTFLILQTFGIPIPGLSVGQLSRRFPIDSMMQALLTTNDLILLGCLLIALVMPLLDRRR